MAQKVNPISVRLNLNRSSDSSWFSDYYYGKLLYQDLNFRDYFGSIRPPTGNTFGFRLGRCIIHHFPKRTFIHVFFLDRLSQSRHQGLGAIPSVKLIRRINDNTVKQRNEVGIWPKNAMNTMIDCHQYRRLTNYFESAIGWPTYTLLFKVSGRKTKMMTEERQKNAMRSLASRLPFW